MVMKRFLFIILPIIFMSFSSKSNELKFFCTLQNINFDEFHSQKYISLEINVNQYFYKFDQLGGGKYYIDETKYSHYSNEEFAKYFGPIYNKLKMTWNKNYLEIELNDDGSKYYFDFINFLFSHYDSYDGKADQYYLCDKK